MKNDNHKVISLNKVVWCMLYYTNGVTITTKKPKYPTVHGREISNPLEIAPPHPDHPQELLLQRALRLQILDKWATVCKVQVQAGGQLTYTGDKAVGIYNAWAARVFNREAKSAEQQKPHNN